ncbi:MAG: hypothetical protein ACYCRD_04755 [Leptospirillum sp.]
MGLTRWRARRRYRLADQRVWRVLDGLLTEEGPTWADLERACAESKELKMAKLGTERSQ